MRSSIIGNRYSASPGAAPVSNTRRQFYATIPISKPGTTARSTFVVSGCPRRKASLMLASWDPCLPAGSGKASDSSEAEGPCACISSRNGPACEIDDFRSDRDCRILPARPSPVLQAQHPGLQQKRRLQVPACAAASHFVRPYCALVRLRFACIVRGTTPRGLRSVRKGFSASTFPALFVDTLLPNEQSQDAVSYSIAAKRVMLMIGSESSFKL